MSAIEMANWKIEEDVILPDRAKDERVLN